MSKEYDPAERIRSIFTAKMDRRAVIKAAAGLGVATFIGGSAEILRNPQLSVEDIGMLVERIRGRGVDFIAHNSGLDSSKRLKAAQAKAGQEYDLVSYNNELYVAHSMNSFMSLSSSERDAQRWSTILPEAADHDGTIKLDIKFDDQYAWSQLLETIDDQLSSRRVLISGEDYTMLRSYPQFRYDQHIMSFTIKNENDYDAFFSKVVSNLRDNDIQNRNYGVSIKHNLVTPERVAALQAENLYVDSWTVDNPMQISRMDQAGVNIITTDNIDFIGMVNEVNTV